MTSTRDIRALLAAGNVVLGPMAGVTEAPFRGICKRMGAGLTYTEMISAKGLHYNPDGAVTRSMLTFDPAETPCAVQIFGSEPDIMADQARGIVERYGDDVACIDINMGCPVTKVVSHGEGSALMRTPELAATIVTRVAERAGVPVTVKFRKGWDDAEVNAVEFARRMESAGAAAVCVHGRTRDQFYRGEADWDVIAAVKAAVGVPVIGSGDIFSAADAAAMLERTGVDAVMVARGAQGNPWIFREARALIDAGVAIAQPTPFERIEMAREHARALVAFGGEHAVTRMRKHVGWYIVGMPGASHVRERVNHVTTSADLDALLAEYRAYLEEHSGGASDSPVRGTEHSERVRTERAHSLRHPVNGAIMREADDIDGIEQPLSEFFAGRDEARSIFDVLRDEIEAFGEVEIRISKSQVAFKRRRNVAVAWTPDRYLEAKLLAPIVLTVWFHRHDDSPRWKQIAATGDGRYAHHLELRSPEEIDDAVRAWLVEAWNEAG